MPNGDTLAIHDASFTDFMTYYDVTLMNPKVLSGMFIGSMMAFLFCGLTMNAVGRAAAHMVEEVRRQFHEIKGILSGEAEPDYARCVRISPKVHNVKWSSVAVGHRGSHRYRTGVRRTGCHRSFGRRLVGRVSYWPSSWPTPAVRGTMPKSISKKVTSAERAARYTAPPWWATLWATRSRTLPARSLNILIKLMSMVAIVMAGLTVSWSLF